VEVVNALRGKGTFKKKGELIMEILNFVVAIVALIIAVIAFQRTGGTKDLRKTTAELLAKMEKKMREEEAAKVEKEKQQK
jgi:hypothetical protein